MIVPDLVKAVEQGKRKHKMNKKIQALAIVAFFDEATDVVSDKIYTFNEEKMQKFAELIVRECAGRMDHILREKKDGGGTMGDEIREHFGVEE